MIGEVWRSLSQGVSRARRRFGTMLAFTFVATLTDVAALVLVVRVAVGLSQGQREVAIPLFSAVGVWVAIGIAFACSVLTAIGHVVSSRLVAGLVADFHHHLQTASVQGFARASWPAQSATQRGQLQEMTSALSLRSGSLVQGLALAAVGCLSVAVFVLSALVVDPLATGALSAIGMVLLAALRPLSRRTKIFNRRFVDSNTEFVSRVANFGEGALELRAFDVTRQAENELKASGRRVRDLQFGGVFYFLLTTLLFKDAAVMVLVVCLGLLALASSSSFLAVGTVAIILLRAVASAQQTNNAYQLINSNYRSLEKIREDLRTFDVSKIQFGPKSIDDFRTLRVDDVHYVYPDGRVALRGVSFDLRKGEALAVVGHSGAGKSTLVELLLRLRMPTCGCIEVNDDLYQNFSENDWSAAVAVVPQTPTMIEGTIAENVRFFRAFEDSAVIKAVAEAGLELDGPTFPDGLHTQLGPRGIGLSGGQRQRLAIARALVGMPSLLILDEPTSALDGDSERVVLHTLSEVRRNRAVIVATHRPNTIEVCDSVLMLKGGAVV